MTEREKMLAGEIYIANDKELVDAMNKKRILIHQFNSSAPLEFELRNFILKKLFNEIGDNCHIEQPFHCDYGCNISIGNNFYANYDCIFIDCAKITIGNNVFFGPRVGLYTAGHPIDADVRNEFLEYAKEITIGNNVWIGGNVTVVPGVKIGNNTIIGAGSVVVKDIPDNAIAVGNPCKPIRKITEEDKKYWYNKRNEYYRNK